MRTLHADSGDGSGREISVSNLGKWTADHRLGRAVCQDGNERIVVRILALCFSLPPPNVAAFLAGVRDRQRGRGWNDPIAAVARDIRT